MKNNWKKCLVQNLGEIKTGKTPRTSIKENYGGDISFLTPSDDMNKKYIHNTIKHITEIGLNEVKNCLIPKNSICISCIGSDLGKVVVTTKPTITNQQINSIIINQNKYDVNFCYYLMVELGKKLNYHSKTSTAVPIINKSSFSNYEISLPPLKTQRKIAKVLSDIDDKIELNNKINENLEQQAQAIFKKYIVNNKSNAVLKDILIEMPKSKIKVGDVKNAKNIKGIYPFFTSGQSILEYDKYLVDGRNIFLNTGGTADVKFYIGKASYSTDTWCIKGKDFFTDMIYLILHNMINELDSSYFEGSALKHLQKQKLKLLPIYIPPKEIILKFNELIIPMFNKISDNIKTNKQLANLRDTLLPKLMSGEIDVENIDIKI